VRSGRLGTCGRCGRCRGRLHGGALYCSFMGAEEIRPSSRWTIWKSVRERSFQSKTSNAGSCYVTSCRRRFGATRETFDAIGLRLERDAARPDTGITERLSERVTEAIADHSGLQRGERSVRGPGAEPLPGPSLLRASGRMVPYA